MDALTETNHAWNVRPKIARIEVQKTARTSDGRSSADLEDRSLDYDANGGLRQSPFVFHPD